MTESADREKRLGRRQGEQDGLQEVRRWTKGLVRPLNVAVIIAAVLMLLLLLIAFWEVVGGIWHYIAAKGSGEGEELSRVVLMKTTVKSFELMLMAPLPLLLIMGLGQYLRAVTGQEAGGKGRLLITEAKALWIGLLIGVFATDLLEKALSEGIHYEESISTAIIVALLMGFFFGLERISHRQRTD